MAFKMRMGIPEMDRYWSELQQTCHNGTASKDEQQLYKKWGTALKLLSENPRHPSLRTHDIDALSRRYGIKVWQSYLENRNSRAMRMYWVYGPGEDSITIIGLVPHPEDTKRGVYEKINLSNLPPLDESD